MQRHAQYIARIPQATGNKNAVWMCMPAFISRPLASGTVTTPIG